MPPEKKTMNLMPTVYVPAARIGSGVVARESRAGVAFRGVGTGRFGGEAAGASFDRVPEDILVESKSQRCRKSPSAF